MKKAIIILSALVAVILAIPLPSHAFSVDPGGGGCVTVAEGGSANECQSTCNAALTQWRSVNPAFSVCTSASYSCDPNGSYGMCLCNCASPSITVDCITASDCSGGRVCVNFQCKAAGGSGCDITNPIAGSAACTAPAGPCNASTQTASCVNDGSGNGVCQCTNNGTSASTPQGNCGADFINTGLGCLNVTGTATIQTLLNWGVVVGGGIAFIMILIAALQINTAQGDAKRVTAGKELLFSALSGLALIALSVVLLNFLGVNILGLNTIGFTP